MRKGERHVLIADKASVIRDALSILTAAIESEGNVSPGTRERLEAITVEECESLILELRAEGDPCGGISPGVRNLRISHIGRDLVVSCEITSPHILQQITDLRRPHSTESS
jgi:hypothetical protein